MRVRTPAGELDLPDGWEVVEDVGTPFHLVAVGPARDGEQHPACTLTTEQVDADHDADERLRRRLHQLDALLDDHHLVDVEVGDGTLRILSLFTVDDGPSLASEQRVRARADVTDVLVLTAAAADLHRHAATFDAIARSWTPAGRP